ncbi:hypothetical protein [Limibacterium fermenti]|uniref:hypothetical protein n=1 Tax=Limibacterium fermenti TaxID=3229863 RepID=UPI003A6F43E0
MSTIKYLSFLWLGALLFGACTIENLERENVPREDFSSYNYVLAIEEASNVDITRFFTFEMNTVRQNTAPYDLLQEDALFTNSDPSVSSGHHSFGRYFFSMAKDKKGYSSTPGIFRLTMNADNRIFIDQSLNLRKNNLFPTKKMCIVNNNTGFYYNEGLAPQRIYQFNPSTMVMTDAFDLREAIEAFRPHAQWVDESGNNMVRTGSLVLEEKEGKLYVSVVFLEKAAFNIIADDETHFYLAVIDIESRQVEKIIRYPDTKTVGFFVSENNPTTKDEDGNLYFCSWGWNQFGTPNPSKIFRIKSGETDFDRDWEFNVEKHFGQGRIAQSIISYNNKVYLHISVGPYGFSESDTPGGIRMAYYELNPADLSIRKLDIPESDTSSRMNVFNLVDDKLYICVPNSDASRFNGLYSVDRSGNAVQELSLENKYRPTRLYKLTN